MKRIKQIGKITILVLFSLLIVCSFPSSSHQSLASTKSTDGFVIEAEEITGTLGVPLITLGKTASRKAVPMIDLAMDNVEVKGLVIKKVTQTPNGPLTTVIKSNGTAKLKKMRVQITNLELGGIFIPKLGYLGMKKVKLLAYKQTADVADLPNFSFSFDSGVGSQMEDKSEEELKDIIKNLQEGTKDEDEKEEEETNETDEQDKEAVNKEEELDKPAGDQPATEPETPEAETPATKPTPEPAEPTEPEGGEDGENPDGGIEKPDSPADDDIPETEIPTPPPGS